MEGPEGDALVEAIGEVMNAASNASPSGLKRNSICVGQAGVASTSSSTSCSSPKTLPRRLSSLGPSSPLPVASNQAQMIGHYRLGKTLGQGNFAKVKLAEHVLTGEEVAIKIIEKSQLSATVLSKLFREVRIMKLLDHPNIVRLYEVIDTQKILYLVMEYCSGGELFDYLVAHGRMKDKEARRVFRQIISAMQYCHAKHVIHRDLKAENLLMDDNMNIKIADFGFSNNYVPGGTLQTFCGSPPYAAPELFQGIAYEGPEVDIWSLGVILYTLVSGGLPFDGSDLKELRERVIRGKYQVPYFVSNETQLFLMRFLQTDPKKRPTIMDVMQDKWMSTGCPEGPLAPYLESVDTDTDLYDEERYVVMESMGFTKEEIDKSLHSSTYDAVTATYFLLGARKRNQPAQYELDVKRAVEEDRQAKLSHIKTMMSPDTPPPKPIQRPGAASAPTSPAVSRRVSSLQIKPRADIGDIGHPVDPPPPVPSAGAGSVVVSAPNSPLVRPRRERGHTITVGVLSHEPAKAPIPANPSAVAQSSSPKPGAANVDPILDSPRQQLQRSLSKRLSFRIKGFTSTASTTSADANVPPASPPTGRWRQSPASPPALRHRTSIVPDAARVPEEVESSAPDPTPAPTSFEASSPISPPRRQRGLSLLSRTRVVPGVIAAPDRKSTIKPEHEIRTATIGATTASTSPIPIPATNTSTQTSTTHPPTPASASPKEPRSLRFAFSISNTSTLPAEEILMRLEKQLTTMFIPHTRTEHFLLLCSHKDCTWEMEVCRVAQLSMHGVRFKRIAGNHEYYRNVVAEVMKAL